MRKRIQYAENREERLCVWLQGKGLKTEKDVIIRSGKGLRHSHWPVALEFPQEVNAERLHPFFSLKTS